MAGNMPRRVYWDSNVFLSYVEQIEDRIDVMSNDQNLWMAMGQVT